MNSKVLEVQNLGKNFNGVKALSNVSFDLWTGEILGLIGPNGAGKTTFFNVLSGFIEPDAGKIIFKGDDITGNAPHRIANLGISRTFQDLRLIRQISVLDNILFSCRGQYGENLTNVFFRRKIILDQEALNSKEAMMLLEKIGMADKSGDPAEDLSYGQQKLLSLVCSLAAKPDVLLLDEPVAGVAPEMIERILGTISELPSTGRSVIFIEHNLEAVMQVCNRVIFMDAGAKVSEGAPEVVRNDPKVIEAYVD